MAITRANGAGWAVDDKLTSGQANAIDLNTTYALDKRAGQTDALASIVSCGGSGRIVDSYAFGADANTTYLLSGANSIIDASGILTADRAYTLSNTGAINGDRVMILYSGANAALTVKDASGATQIVLGANVSGAAGSLSNGESSWVDMIWNGAWRVWRSSKPAVMVPTTYTANGTWTCPRGVTLALIIGWGGGGGGGGGAAGVSAPGRASSGGGGGGSALQSTVLAVVTPGTGYAVTIGSAGGGGAAGAPGGAGAPSALGSQAFFIGAGGGVAGAASATSSSYEPYAPGGTSPVAGAGQVPTSPGNILLANLVGIIAPGSGGAGTWSVSVVAAGYFGTGGGVPGGGYGGYSGSIGLASGSYNGGGLGGGGGGGNGYGANGVRGGNGGAANSAGAGAAGAAGASAAPNTGGGGSGGGGGGSGSTSSGAGAAGGNGSAGQITVVPIR